LSARGALGALLIGSLAGASPAPAQDGPAGIAVVRDTVTVTPGNVVGCLRQSFVFPSTVTLREEGRVLVSGKDYLLDADAGCFTLLHPDTTGRGRVITASFRALPRFLEGTYQLAEDPHRRRAGVAAGDERASPVPGFTEDAETSGLDISGSKTFGIEIGNRRDLKLRQSLDLRLSGKVSRDVTLLAILSDQDVPFQPEGSTAELSDLDRILVQLESPRAGASLGDVNLSTTGFAFLDLNRELEGFTGRAGWPGVEARGAVASAKGEFASREFFGEDGKQGPYRLTDRTGSDNIVIVAGSESIWLDGRLLARGREEDYVIDYGLGEITFSSRHAITANSQIAVDYQYATGRYRRRIAYAGGEGTAGPAGTLRAAFFTEGDDADNPFGGDLTDPERSQLAALGDSAQVGGGTVYVGDGKGDYDLVVDPESGKDIFVFVDGTGDYDVIFVNVGEGKGGYAPQPEPVGGRVVYAFVGEGNGDFIPRRDLPAPERRRITDLRWEWGGRLGSVNAEGAVSTADGNILSPLDDGDNDGGALQAVGAFRPLPLGGAWTVTPRFTVRRQGENFQSPARLRSGFYGRDWNLTGVESIRDEMLAEAGTEVAWGNRLRWTADAGRLALADTFTAKRLRQSAAWSDPWFQVRGDWNLTRDAVGDSRGRLDHQNGEIQFRRFRIQPRFRGLHDVRRRASGSGDRSRDWELALVVPERWGPLRGEIGGGRRLDDSLRTADDAWREIRDARRGFVQVEGQWERVSALVRYEARRVKTGESGTERRDTGRLDLRHQAARGAWNAILSADVGTVGLRQRQKIIAPDSSGFFDRFGNFTGPGGGYDVRLGDFRPETLTGQVDLSTRLRWSTPGKAVAVPAVLRAVAWEGFLGLTENSTLPLVQPRYFLDPGSYLNREATLDGRLNERQVLDLFPSNRLLGFRVRQELRHRMNASPTDTTGGRLVEIDNDHELAGTLRSNPSPGWDGELEGTWGTRREEIDLGSDLRFVQDTDLWSATVRGGRRFQAVGGRGRLSLDATYSRETGETAEARAWVLKPRIQWSVSGGGRIDVRYARTRFISKSGFTALKGAGAPSLTEGWRLDVLAELRLKPGIVVTGAMGIDHPQNLVAVTEGRMEVRGTF
jgi:hypothetical protein